MTFLYYLGQLGWLILVLTGFFGPIILFVAWGDDHLGWMRHTIRNHFRK